MSQSKFNPKQLRKTIVNEKTPQRTIYYSLVKKQQKNFSFISNERLLILNFEVGRLYYVNDNVSPPFGMNVPSPKKQFAQLPDAIMRKVVGEANLLEVVGKYNGEPILWKFTFETKQLAYQWLQLIQMQRDSANIQEKDMKALNKSILDMPKVQKKVIQDIVKEPQRDIIEDQSRLLDLYSGNSRMRNYSPTRNPPPQEPPNRSIFKTDWNYRFYRQPTFETLYEFQFAAISAFQSALQQDKDGSGVRQFQGESIEVFLAKRGSEEGKTLRREFQNMHFIIQATRSRGVVGVPLSCYFQFQENVGLARAKLPPKADPVSFDVGLKEDLRDLQRYTRVKNKILQKCKIVDVRRVWEPKRNTPLLYLFNLFEYLPLNLSAGGWLRAQHMLDNVQQMVHAGAVETIGRSDLRQLREIGQSVGKNSKQFGKDLLRLKFAACNAIEVKQALHEVGINARYLSSVYAECENTHIRRHIYSAMAASVAKDYLAESCLKLIKEAEWKKVLQEGMITLLEGGNNRSHQMWKQVCLLFKRRYGLQLNQKDILPGFFLNSLIRLFPGNYDCKRINRQKRIFEEQRVIEHGFIQNLTPKVKGYIRFLPEDWQGLKFAAKESVKSEEIFRRIVSVSGVRGRDGIPSWLRFGRNDQWLIDYLCYYIPPQEFQDVQDEKIRGLYARINEQPPSLLSLRLTNNYLEWCIKKEKTAQFKEIFEIGMKIADYWLEDSHPLRSDLLERLSDYNCLLGVNEDMLKYMNKSVNMCIKFGGPDCQEAGLKYYELADRYLRASRKKQAVEYFLKAKENIESNRTRTNRHGLALMKLASIYLSDLDYDRAVELAYQSVRSFEDFEKRVNSMGVYNQPFKIKAYEILARVFEICERRAEYKQMALTCARKFNSTKSKQVFQQMVRICTAAAIFKCHVDRCQALSRLIASLSNEQMPFSQITPTEQLMRLGNDTIVMERFIIKFEYFQRSLFQLNVKKRQLSDQNRQFVGILRCITGSIGQDYVQGLIEEKMSHKS